MIPNIWKNILENIFACIWYTLKKKFLTKCVEVLPVAVIVSIKFQKVYDPCVNLV